jgi:peroxiredoxin
MPKIKLIVVIALFTIVLTGLVGCSSATVPSSTPITAPMTVSELLGKTPATGPTEEITPSVTPTVNTEKNPSVEIGPQVGKLAPDFTYRNPAGNRISISSLRGSWIILNFWATWCGPCKYEMPLLQALANDKEKAEKGLTLLTISSGETAETVQDFLKKTGYSFPVLLDSQYQITYAYYVRAYPTTFFIGQDGIIKLIKVGAFMKDSELAQSVDNLMNSEN